MIAFRISLFKPCRILFRRYASNTKLVEMTMNDKTGISIISMAKPPVNSLNLEMLDALRTSLAEAQQNRVAGIVFTSSLPAIFSAGLDIMEMYNPDTNRLKEFWKALQDMWFTMYCFPMPIAAAINGASPAGGCLLAISCEYRAMVKGQYGIGLNETQLGIIAPKWFRDPFITTIGYRQAELALLRGSLFKPEQAMEIGLVDDLASDKSDAIAKCEGYISSFASIPVEARRITKLELHKPLLTWFKANRESDVNEFCNFIQSPKVQAGLHLYIQSLKKK